MKRAILALLAVCLLCGAACIRIDIHMPETTAAPNPSTQEPIPVTTQAPAAATDAPTEPPYAPDLSGLPLVFSPYEKMEEGQAEALMFTFDLDFDGTPEEIRVFLDWENDDTVITDGTRSYTFENSAMLSHVFLIDLDPDTSYANLIVCVDEASDDYVTVVLHPEGNQLVAGEKRYLYSVYDWGAGEILGYERTDFLGTRSGWRFYTGETLEPISDWQDCRTPSKEELTTEREMLIEMGILLHAATDMPCKLNGDPYSIAKGSYVYLLRYSDELGLAELCTEDGTHLDVSFTRNEDDWGYCIEGVQQDDCFDNLFYAD